VALGGLTDTQRPSAANGLDADSFEAICFAVSEKLRREYRRSKTWAVETADEMVDQAYIEYAEKSEAEQDEAFCAGLGQLVALGSSMDGPLGMRMPRSSNSPSPATIPLSGLETRFASTSRGASKSEWSRCSWASAR
jgi:hypothetical protein